MLDLIWSDIGYKHVNFSKSVYYICDSLAQWLNVTTVGSAQGRTNPTSPPRYYRGQKLLSKKLFAVRRLGAKSIHTRTETISRRFRHTINDGVIEITNR